MTKLVKVLLMLARLLVVVQLALGLAIWPGGASLAAPHSALGSLFVLDAWIIALIALFALPRRAVPLFTLAFGAVVMWLGMAQMTLLVGSAHWTVRVVHLLLGLALLGLVEMLAKAVRVHRAETP
jgi:hypothetical protein